MLRQVLDCTKSKCIEKSGDTPGTLSTRLEEYREKPVAREPGQKDAASSLQVCQKDAEMDKSTRRLVAAEKDQELLNFHENLKSTRKLVASGNSDIDGNGTKWPHNLHISTAYVSHLEKILSNVRQRYGRKLGDKMEDLDVDTITW